MDRPSNDLESRSLKENRSAGIGWEVPLLTSPYPPHPDAMGLSPTWRFIGEPVEARKAVPPVHWAAYQMAIDEAISLNLGLEESAPTLRMYTWPFKAITIGYFQSIHNEINMKACEKENIPVIRRWTGGQAVLHGGDLTYSLIAPAPSPIFPINNVRDTLHRIGKIFHSAFLRVGLNVTFATPDSRSSKESFCFYNPSWHEITHEGRKIMGSAQRRWRGGFLQQGSILFSFHPEEIHRLFLRTNEKKMKDPSCMATGINDLLGNSISDHEILVAVLDSIRGELGVDLQSDRLTSREISLAENLVHQKYGQTAWNHDRRTPSPKLTTL